MQELRNPVSQELPGFWATREYASSKHFDAPSAKPNLLLGFVPQPNLQ
ncbi:MAG: hypothetical protein GDA43_08450 [Hormoscilla sp. SP5CHS1]|nr:hypothetical protein [Hormoscilla sp. SP5CHS1]MBC6475997.1 hypothetical protein [Hormoscilla sp. GM102CHS1]